MQSIITTLIERVRQTKSGFADIRLAADEAVTQYKPDEALEIAKTLFASDVVKARMTAVFILGHFATHSEWLSYLRAEVSKDPDWRVQEILAQAFNHYCRTVGYENALPVIEDWLADGNPKVRRAVSEGLRIWTSKTYFREHPEVAVQALSALNNDESEYVRKSVGNALRDISRKHADLVRAEVANWDTSNKRIRQTYKLASKFLAE
jgi:3-methyladenine DNA glycosylase AlkD